MGMLKQYRSGAWESRARGGGTGGGGSGTTFDTNFYYSLSADQAVTTGANRKMAFDTLQFDGNSEWDVAGGYWLCKTTGYYTVNLSASALGTYTNLFRSILYVDGALAHIGQAVTGTSGYNTTSIIIIPNMYIVAGSYLEAYCRVTANTSVASALSTTWFRITRYK